MELLIWRVVAISPIQCILLVSRQYQCDVSNRCEGDHGSCGEGALESIRALPATIQCLSEAFRVTSLSWRGSAILERPSECRKVRRRLYPSTTEQTQGMYYSFEFLRTFNIFQIQSQVRSESNNSQAHRNTSTFSDFRVCKLSTMSNPQKEPPSSCAKSAAFN